MELLLEVIIYLLVVLGLITVCFTFFNKFSFLNSMISNEVIEEIDEVQARSTYCREKKENAKVTVNVRYKNISSEELDKIKECIEIGNYNNISDIADEINYIESIPKKSKTKNKYNTKY